MDDLIPDTQDTEDTQDTQDTEELGTEEYLQQLGLPELDGQVTVEIVVEKSPEEEEDEEAETSEAEGADPTDNEEPPDDGADSTDNEESSEDGDDGTSEEEEDEEEDEEEEETAERSKITVQLNTSAAPVTAANFADLVDQNFYDGLAFHRFVEDFVVQVGDPASRDETILEELRKLGSGQYIKPGTDEPRTIPLEIKVKDGEIVYNEIVDDPVELSHEQGVIAMARRNSPLDSASSQFYFTLEDRNDLDGRYAVFGEVTDGFDVVQELREGDRILLATIVEGDVSSRKSEIIPNHDLLNKLSNYDGENKSSYVLSMQEDAGGDENVDSSDGGTEVSPIIDDRLLSSQLDTPLDQLPDDENSEEEDQEEEDQEEEDQGDEIASAIDEEEEEETTEETEDDDDDILDIDVVDSFTTELGTDGDDVIDVLEITDADPDSSFAIMGLAGNDTISGGNSTDILSGNEGNDRVSGRDGSDFLRGGKGDDILIGGKGDDFLLGDLGIDILTGGAGADSFILRTDIAEMDEIEEIDQANRITDFNVADGDRIIIIAEFIPTDGLTYQLVDGDAVIRLLEGDFILGVVEETSIEDVQNNIIAVNPDDLALSLG